MKEGFHCLQVFILFLVFFPKEKPLAICAEILERFCRNHLNISTKTAEVMI
jgi:hypothetical protein